MFCANCGDKASKKYVFCMECGEVLEFTSVAQPFKHPAGNFAAPEVAAKPFKLNPLVPLAALLVIGIAIFAVTSRDLSDVASTSPNGANQEFSGESNSNETNTNGQISNPADSSSNSSSNSDDSGSVSAPDNSQGNQEQAPQNIKWVPTVSAIKTCANDPKIATCPGQSGVSWEYQNELNVDGKALAQKLIDKGVCKNSDPSNPGPAGFDGEWKCYSDSGVFVVVTGNQNIVKILNIKAPYHWAAVDGALIYGTRLSEEVLEILGATFIKITN
jgi:hypothetical protein